jgi:hypothetical protein
VLFVFRVSYKSFVGGMCVKNGTISWLALVFFGQDSIEFLVLLFASGLK